MRSTARDQGTLDGIAATVNTTTPSITIGSAAIASITRNQVGDVTIVFARRFRWAPVVRATCAGASPFGFTHVVSVDAISVRLQCQNDAGVLIDQTIHFVAEGVFA